MIGLAFAVLTLLLIGAPMGMFNWSKYTNQDERPNSKHILRVVMVVVLAAIVGIFEPITVQRIDAGNIGLGVDRVGNNKGVPKAIPVKGWVFYNAWTRDIVEYSIRQNHVSYKDFSVTTKGGFPMTVAPSFNYALKPEAAAELYINLLKGSDFSSLESNFLMTATQLSLNNASNKYTIDSIFNNKEAYNMAVAAELNKELSKYFVVTQINPGTVPPLELKDVIVAKTNAIQDAQKSELQRITADNNAKVKIANAKGDSAEKVINALAEAKSIELKTKELSPTYVEYIKWSGADGSVPRVPATVLGSGTGYILNNKQ